MFAYLGQWTKILECSLDIWFLELCFHLERAHITLSFIDLKKNQPNNLLGSHSYKHSLILNNTESAWFGPTTAYVELLNCRLESSGRSQALVTITVHLRPNMKL